MTPKERIAAAVARSEPDKVPSHINATKWVISKLKTFLSVDSDKALLEALHVDVYDMRGIDIHSGTAPKYVGPENEFFPEDWAGAINSFWNIKEFENKTDSGWNMEMEAPPLTNTASIEELENYPWPDNNWFDYSDLKDKLELWKDFSIMASGASVFQHATYLRGMDTLMMDMMANPEIELGVDILDPIQPESMDPVAIKQKYGNDICLRGGISVQNVVSRGTLDEVKAETKRIVEALKPGGGFIFSPGHPVLQDDIPVENIIAMYETGYQYGFY